MDNKKGLLMMMYSFGVENEDMKILNDLNLNIEQILKEANVPYRVFEDSKFNLTEDQYISILDVISKHVKIESVLIYNDVENRTVFDPSVFAGLCAENGLECINRFVKYNRLNGPLVFEVTEDGEQLEVSVKYKNGGEMPGFALLSQQVTLISMIRKGSGISSLKPIQVLSPYGYSVEVNEYFGITTEKNVDNKITFSFDDLKIPFVTSNNNMWQFMKEELNKRIEELETDDSYAARVRKVLLDVIPSGISDADYVSKELGVSRRTLQRKLKDESTTFLEQLNHTRELMVRNYLQMNMTLDEIAFWVNYSDSKALSRAFKIWSGMSVTEYRKTLEY